MPTRERDYYLALRRRYEPDRARLIIVAESPPASGKYFYDPSGKTTEPLFKYVMRQLGTLPATKEAGLGELQRQGWILVDATYKQVDKLAKDDALDRDEIILRDYPLLVHDLTRLTRNRSTPLVLIKANVCRALEPKLRSDGFNVINNGSPIYFPSNGRQPDFERQFAATLMSAGIAPVSCQ